MTSKAERWAETHASLLDAASRLLRERGLRSPSVADVMGKVGLTVGGFYGHFASKDALFDEVLRTTYHGMWTRLLAETRGDTPEARLVSVVRRYLSRTHRDARDEGCPLPSTLGEVGAIGDPYRATLASELDAFADELGSVAGPLGGRKLALGLIALLAGGLTLSRAVAGTPLSDAILESSRALAYSVIQRRE